MIEINLSYESIIENFKEIRKRFIKHGISIFSGDCGNFAVALFEFLNADNFVVAYISKEDQKDQNPTHVAIEWNNEIWDASGLITEEDMEAYAKAFRMKYNPKGFVIKTNDYGSFINIINEKRVLLIYNIIKEVFLIKNYE